MTRGRGNTAIQIAQKCASCMYGGPDPANNFTEHRRGPVIDIFQASSVLSFKTWVVVEAHNASGEVGYGAVRPVLGGARLVNHSDMVHQSQDVSFVGQVLMEEEWTPLILVAGTQGEFGSRENFTTALQTMDDSLVVALDNSSVAATWASMRIEFFPNTQPGAYRLPKVDGVTIDVNPEFTYSGPNLMAAGREPEVVVTKWKKGTGAGSGLSYETLYNFSDDSVTTTSSSNADTDAIYEQLGELAGGY